MPINSTHPQYKKFSPQWIRCRDVMAGSDAIKDAGVKYLPKLEGQTPSEYKAYKNRALFFSVAGRSLEGLVGMVTRKPPSVTYESSLEPYFADSEQSRSSFSENVRIVASELLSTGRIFSVVDWPPQGGRAFIAHYVAEASLNWQLDDDGNLLWIVLKYTYTEPSSEDQFETVEVAGYALLSVQSGVYTVTKYNDDGEATITITPTISGKPLTSIPGVFVNANGISADIIKPPMLDIVDVNLSQYVTSADLEHGRHFTALPTPVVSGVSAETSLRIGSQTAWAIPEKAKAYYMEFQGSGLSSLEGALSEKTSQMAQFSTRLMDTSSRGSEAVDAVRLRHSSEAATLSSVVTAVENTLIFLYKIVAQSERTSSPSIQLNKDFLDSRLSHSELKELSQALLDGSIDKETFFFNLQRGEMIPKDKTQMNSEPKVDADDT